MKSIAERYTQEEYKLIEEIRNVLRITRNDGFSGNYQPYQIKADLHLSQLGYLAKINGHDVSVNMYVRNSKLDFAIQVWEIAQDFAEEKYRDYLHYEWLRSDDPIKQLSFKSKNRSKSEAYFKKLLVEICNDQKISVNERAIFKRHEHVGYTTDNLRLEVCLDVEKVTDKIVNQLRKQFSANKNYFPLDKTGLRYTYEDIKDYFVYLDSHLLSLLNADDGQKYPNKIEKKLFKHAQNFDLEKILEALDQGADINAINTHGMTILADVIMASRYDSMGIETEEEHRKAQSEIPEFTTEDKIGFAQILLNRGADINLFGFGGVNILQEASYFSDPVMIKFLLDRGANPNLNYFPEDNGPDISHPLDNILDMYDDKNTEALNDQLRECERLLRAAGAK